MASSSDESCKAPGNFQVFQDDTNDDQLNTSNDDIENHHKSFKCPLCNAFNRFFLCRDCVRTGQFCLSNQKYGETLAEKQQKYLRKQTELKEISNGYERLIKSQKSCENVEFDIKRKREELQRIHQLIAGKKMRIKKLQRQRQELCNENNNRRKNLQKYPIEVKKLENFVLDRDQKNDELKVKNTKLLETLQENACNNIQKLVRYIFPITEIVLKDGRHNLAIKNIQSDETETVTALTDAINTSDIRGQWVFHGSGISEMQYRIVAPSLPANGDYTAYLDWVFHNSDEVPKSTPSEVRPSQITGYRIVGALTYTTQLLQLMSYYLNVPLPYKLAYGDFSKKLNNEQFRRKVSRLNSNIMYLAYTQGVNLRTLTETHTLENILAILDLKQSNLGRHGYHDVGNAPLMKSMDSLLIGIETATETESEDENSLRLDWESVPNMPLTHLPEMNTNFMPPGAPQPPLTESLITSAANRLTSFLRWKK